MFAQIRLENGQTMVKLTASEPSQVNDVMQVKDVMMSIVTLENQPLPPQSAIPESQATRRS
jgi:hypothetical protein